MIRHLAITLALGAAAPAAAAECTMAPPVNDAATCAQSNAATEALAPVENLWLGYVGQVFSEAADGLCGEAQVVVDCADGSAFLFAPAGAALMEAEALDAARAGTYGELMGSLREMPWGYDEMVGWDEAAELRVVDLGTILDGPVALGSHGAGYDLSCGCKMLNPASPGAM